MNNQGYSNWEKDVSKLACEKIAKAFLETDISDVVISDRARERAEKIFADAEAETIIKRRATRRRVAIILVAAIISALTACIAIPKVREKLYEIVITYHDKYLSVQSEPVTNETTEETDSFVIANETYADSSDNDTADSTAGATVSLSDNEFVKRIPTYIPEGYELFLDDSTNNSVGIDYFNISNGSMINYQQTPIGVLANYIDSEDSSLESIKISEFSGIYTIKTFNDNIKLTLFWNDSAYDYLIESTLSLDELIKIAESIK